MEVWLKDEIEARKDSLVGMTSAPPAPLCFIAHIGDPISVTEWEDPAGDRFTLWAYMRNRDVEEVVSAFVQSYDESIPPANLSREDVEEGARALLRQLAKEFGRRSWETVFPIDAKSQILGIGFPRM